MQQTVKLIIVAVAPGLLALIVYLSTGIISYELTGLILLLTAAMTIVIGCLLGLIAGFGFFFFSVVGITLNTYRGVEILKRQAALEIVDREIELMRQSAREDADQEAITDELYTLNGWHDRRPSSLDEVIPLYEALSRGELDRASFIEKKVAWQMQWASYREIVNMTIVPSLDSGLFNVLGLYFLFGAIAFMIWTKRWFAGSRQASTDSTEGPPEAT